MYACIYTYTHTHVYSYLYIYIHIYIDKNGNTHYPSSLELTLLETRENQNQAALLAFQKLALA